MVWNITDQTLNHLWTIGILLSIIYYWLRTVPEAKNWIDLMPLLTFFTAFTWSLSTGAVLAKIVNTGSVGVDFPPAAVMTAIAALVFWIYFLGAATDTISTVLHKVIK